MRTIQDRMLHPWTYSATVKHKPLSINAAYYKNKRRTPAYLRYEEAWFDVLRDAEIPSDIDKKDMLFRVDYIWGFSNRQADCDNPIKTTTDVMQNHFGFNDKQIYIIKATKTIVPKGSEFATVTFREIFREDLL